MIISPYHIEYNEKNYEQRILSSARRNSKRYGHEFSIDVEDITIPDVCPYLGIKLTRLQGSGYQQSNASIDRIDSTKGYIKGNIQIISRMANQMKQNATQEQLVTFAKHILELYERPS